MARKPGFRVEPSFDIRCWTFGFAGPYVGYTGGWWNFYAYFGPFSLNFERVRGVAT